VSDKLLAEERKKERGRRRIIIRIIIHVIRNGANTMSPKPQLPWNQKRGDLK
jgi:hypothetical protein